MRKIIRLSIFLMAFVQTVFAVELTMTTSGSPGGVYNQLVGDICKLFNSSDDLGSCVTRSSSGSVENIERVNLGAADIGIVQSDVLLQEIQRGNADNVSPLMGMYIETVLLVVHRDSKIRGFTDLAEKRVNIGPSGSGIANTANFILEKAGINSSDFAAISTLSPFARETGNKLCTGELDAMFYVSGTPSKALHSLVASCDINLIGVPRELAEQIMAENKYFYSSVIPKGTYFGVNQIESIGVQAILIANNKKIDAKKGAEITKTLIDNMNQIKSNVKAMEFSDDKMFLGPQQLGVSLLKGAEDYYRQVGILKE